MRKVTECLLETFNNGDHAVSVRYAGDRDWTTLYIGPDRAEAHQHNTRAMLNMDTWQPYRSELEAMLLQTPPFRHRRDNPAHSGPTEGIPK